MAPFSPDDCYFVFKRVWCNLSYMFTFYLNVSDSLLSGHLKGVSVLGTQEELHLDARRKTQDGLNVIISVTIAEISL